MGVSEGEVLHEVQPTKPDAPSQLWRDAHQALASVLAAQEVLAFEVVGHLVQAIFGVDAVAGCLQGSGGDVRGEDVVSEVRSRLGELAEDHGQRVGLHADGAAGAPELQTTLALSIRPPLWQQGLGQEIEVGGLTEELGGVGRDHVDEVVELVFQAGAAEEILAVGAVIWYVQDAKTLLQPRLQHGLLGARHFDADFRVDERAELLELLLAHRRQAEERRIGVLQDHGVVRDTSSAARETRDAHQEWAATADWTSFGTSRMSAMAPSPRMVAPEMPSTAL